MEINTVLVVGCGTMGAGIAQVCAQSGLQVIVHDLSLLLLEKASAAITWSLEKLASKGHLNETVSEVMCRIRLATELEAVAQAQVVIEAIFEDRRIKQELFAKLEGIVSPRTILASNTSAIPISALAGGLAAPHRMLGLHFFNPAPLMQAVEVVRGVATSDQTMQQGAAFVRSIGKEPIVVNSDLAGFILNRTNMLASLEAMRLVERQVATPQDIDLGFRLAFGRKMGPFETSDLVGLDVQLMAINNVYEEEKDPRFYPPSILRRMVQAGRLGRKSGRGWYEYGSKDQAKQTARPGRVATD